MQQSLAKENIEVHYTSNSNHTSNADIERLHNTINEHIGLFTHHDRNEEDTVEEKIMRIIGFYNNSVHSITGRKPIDFTTGKIHENEYENVNIDPNTDNVQNRNGADVGNTRFNK
uniref:Integrase catalytic domain-containing protein n=1 Tax=Glossina brevipalpis TaxID=37001 RepID=A0A1A9WP03_9MUSC